MGCTTQGEKAALVKELREEGYSLKYLLKAMELPKSTYYFKLSKENIVEKRNETLSKEIRELFIKHKGRHGVRRIHKALVEKGYRVNRKRV